MQATKNNNKPSTANKASAPPPGKFLERQQPPLGLIPPFSHLDKENGQQEGDEDYSNHAYRSATFHEKSLLSTHLMIRSHKRPLPYHITGAQARLLLANEKHAFVVHGEFVSVYRNRGLPCAFPHKIIVGTLFGVGALEIAAHGPTRRPIAAAHGRAEHAVAIQGEGARWPSCMGA
jgi:hypothetical protein